MSAAKTVIFVGDGMADEPIAELDGRTPLEAAATPAMDRLAREGRNGSLLTLPGGFPTSSEVANMSILGCDLAAEYCGRGPLEAVGRGIRLGPEDKAFRLNLTTQEDGILRDYSAGHIAQEHAESLIAALGARYGSETVRFYPGVSYRTILVLSGPGFSHRVQTEKPDDNQGNRVDAHLPAALEPDAEATAALLRTLMLEAPVFLPQCPPNHELAVRGKAQANGLWPWSGGVAGALRTLAEGYAISGAVVSAVDVIVGLGRCLGMDAVAVEGATGYIDTNYEGKADAAVEALDTHDLVYVHVEATDEVSHEQNLELKVRAIEDFDRRVVGRTMAALDWQVNAAVLPDHPVPIALGQHTRTPVPVAVRVPGEDPDAVATYSESTCPAGGLGAMAGGDLMALLFGPRRDAP